MAFDALEVALQLIRALREPVAIIARFDPDLARQIKRAANGIAAQLSEGRERVGKDRGHLFRVALGSASEVRDHLRVAEAWGYVQPETLEASRALLDRERAMLWRLVHPRR